MQTLAVSGTDRVQSNILLNATIATALVLMSMAALMAGKSVLALFAIALLLWFIINALARRLASFACNTGEPGLRSLATAILTVIAFCFGVAEVVAANITAIVARAPNCLVNIETLTGKLTAFIGWKAMAQVTAAIDGFDFEVVILSLAKGMAGDMGSATAVVIYIVFLIAEQKFMHKKLKAMADDNARYAKFSAVFAEIGQCVRTYLFTKSLTSAAMAAMVWIALTIAGVDFAGFWAFLVFILNFIPVIGGIVSGVFPAAFRACSSVSRSP